MPLYDYQCGNCGRREDFYSLHELLTLNGRQHVLCANCGCMAPVLVGEPSVGCPPMQEFVVPGAGINCQSQAEVEAWKAAHPNADVLVPGTPEYRNLMDLAADKKNVHAQRLGFRHWADYAKDHRAKVAGGARMR